jgi:hypothetical protein
MSVFRLHGIYDSWIPGRRSHRRTEREPCAVARKELYQGILLDSAGSSRGLQ